MHTYNYPLEHPPGAMLAADPTFCRELADLAIELIHGEISLVEFDRRYAALLATATAANDDDPQLRKETPS